MSKKWVVADSEAAARSLASELDLHPALASILFRRGLSSRESAQIFLNPSFERLESPFEFIDMSKAVERIQAAIARKEKILVYGDYDVDGVTASAIVYPALKKLGANVESFIPHRIHEGYGLSKESLAKKITKDLKLVITVDNGISGHEAIEYLNSKGIDSILVDHHLPKDTMPPAYAIISNCQGGKGDGNLAACGLAFKLVWALFGDFDKAKEYLDLVALGTVADLAPLLGDNRILVKNGLSAIAKTKKPGLKALMFVSGINPNFLGYRDIAFGLGPRINASGRMGSPENAFKLLTTENEYEARNLAQLLDQGNKDRQKAEKEAFDQAVAIVEASDEIRNSLVIVVSHGSWHEGVLGIVASRLVERYHKPALVISSRSGKGKGSGRSTEIFSLHDHLTPCEDLFVNFGGHAQACGLTIEIDKIGEFRRRVNDVARQKQGEVSEARLNVDGELGLHEIDQKFLSGLERLAPFGPGNPKPLFISKNVRFKSEPKKRGQDTLVCWMSDQAGKTVCEAVGFRMYERWSKAEKKPAVDIVYQPALKNYQGIASIELQLEDWA